MMIILAVLGAIAVAIFLIKRIQNRSYRAGIGFFVIAVFVALVYFNRDSSFQELGSIIYHPIFVGFLVCGAIMLVSSSPETLRDSFKWKKGQGEL